MEQHEWNLKDLLRRVASRDKLRDKLLQSRLSDAWEALYPQFKSYTESVQFSRGKLAIQLSSAALRAELMYNKDLIINQLNDHLGEECIQEIALR
ncbi:MAG: DUF721 domain-containing protein [Saprospiraceae bacterium]|nr:DUF721 domain-containing protein [Saprospiraceae bacterium]